MSLVVISVDRDALPEHTDEHFKEWAHYEIAKNGSISHSNPLYDIDINITIKEIG